MSKLETWSVRLVRETVDVPQPTIHDAATVAELWRELYGDLPHEQFVAFMLSTRHRIIGVHVITMGILDASLVHPREVFRAAILANASRIIIAHNHPSGDPTPSREDYRVTEQLQKAGEVLGIPLLDHVVIGDTSHCSCLLWLD